MKRVSSDENTSKLQNMKVGLLYSFYSKKFKLILIKRPQTPVVSFLIQNLFYFYGRLCISDCEQNAQKHNMK